MNDRYQRSKQLLERAKKVTPLGAQTYSKSYRYFVAGAAPAFLERGEGCYVWDVDGNKYLDFICALGPVTVGYNDWRVNQAITRQLSKGIAFSQPVELSVQLAEKLIEILPGAEMVRFVKNGSDATAAAVRLARAYTGRELIAVCGYHGMQDWYIGSTANRRGVPQAVCDLVKPFQYNDLESLQQLFRQYPGAIAGVILEPIQGDGPREGFLQELKDLVHSQEALLIFDEVVSGFRYALGGAAELYKVIPDLAAYGKGMGNGMPLSAVIGRREIMNLIAEGVFISTTFGGEALSLAGALATIEILEQPGVYERIWRLGGMMLEGLRNLINEQGLSEVLIVSGLAPHGGLLFEGTGSLDYLDVNSVYQQQMIERRILTHGMYNLNLAHTEVEARLFLEAAADAIGAVKKAVDRDSTAEILAGGKLNPVFKRNSR